MVIHRTQINAPECGRGMEVTGRGHEKGGNVHSVYKYVLNGEIIYIGKSDSNLDMRLKQHGKTGDNITKEAWNEIKAADIYYIPLVNSIMSDVVESELIRRYMPKWNIAKKETEWSGIPFQEPEWIKYIPKKDNAKRTIDKAKREMKRVENLLSDLEHNSYPARMIAYIVDSIVDHKYVIEDRSYFGEEPESYIVINTPPCFTEDDFINKCFIYIKTKNTVGCSTPIGGIGNENGRIYAEFYKKTFKDRIIECINEIVQTAEYICKVAEKQLPEYVDLINEKRTQFEIAMRNGVCNE